MKQFSAWAPGSLFLMGEHAVLRGRMAIVCAVDEKITATLTPRGDETINISSELGEYQTQISDVKLEKPFTFVLAAIDFFKNNFVSGFDLKIESDFSHELGLGSSAAVTVATLRVLSEWLGVEIDLLSVGISVIRKVQGVGSGADVAASVYGGVIAFQDGKVEELNNYPPFVHIYSGSKTPTVDVIKKVEARFESCPSVRDHIFDSIHLCSEAARELIINKSWNELGKIFDLAQGFMEALGVSNDELNKMLADLRGAEHISGAKISGAGLGDCIIGVRCDAS